MRAGNDDKNMNRELISPFRGKQNNLHPMNNEYDFFE